jgi:predicted Fe-S protein YdhL (DUF1289 family)
MLPIPNGPIPLSPRASSPCIGICRLDDAGVTCVGCRRTLDEIRRWSTLSPVAREAILERLRQPVASTALPDDGDASP